MSQSKYTCAEYRREMILAGLKRQLARTDLPEGERVQLEAEIRKLETEMGMA